MNTIAQDKTVVVGLGKTGMACVRYLSAQGVDLIVMDSQTQPTALASLQAEFPDVETVLGGLDADMLAEARMLVVSPGVPLHHPAIAAAVSSGVEVVGDIELFARRATAPVIAITGSNGKSTVTSLVYEMARDAGRDVRVGGNIGTPVLELLQQVEPELYVLELSSFQLETTYRLNAAAATVLNLSQDHLDRYSGMDDYAEAKKRIYNGDGVMVVNLDDGIVRNWVDPKRRCVGFSLTPPRSEDDFGAGSVEGRLWLFHGNTALMAASELKMAGMHNVANALAALALGYVAGLPLDSMLKTLRRYTGLPHRCQWVAQENGVDWYNDSKATNVGAAVAAIKGFNSQVVLIAGGLAKGQDFAELAEVLAEKGRAVVLIGRDAGQIKKLLPESMPVSFAANMGEAVSCAHALALPGDVVLLSPACASFDMFSGYEDRGDQFAAAVGRRLS